MIIWTHEALHSIPTLEFGPYRIARLDTDAAGDSPKIYILESLTHLNGAPSMPHVLGLLMLCSQAYA